MMAKPIKTVEFIALSNDVLAFNETQIAVINLGSVSSRGCLGAPAILPHPRLETEPMINLVEQRVFVSLPFRMLQLNVQFRK